MTVGVAPLPIGLAMGSAPDFRQTLSPSVGPLLCSARYYSFGGPAAAPRVDRAQLRQPQGAGGADQDHGGPERGPGLGPGTSGAELAKWSLR